MEINRTLFIWCFLTIGLMLFVQQGFATVSMFGTTGLVSIPTAYILPDGKLALGVSYTDKRYGRYSQYSVTQVAYYATLAYLPFLEVSLRATQYPNFSWSESYTSGVERMASVKLQLLKEKQYFPSVVLGVNDLYGKTIQYNAQYIVASKFVNLPLLKSVGIHVGYAPNPVKSDRIQNYSIKGGFAGLEAWLYKPLASIMFEYDSRKYNVGLRIAPYRDWFYADVVILGMKRISGAMSVSFDL